MEVYSSQTRQTRTALGISSFTFAAYSLLGIAEDKVGVFSSGFEVPSEALPYLLGLPTVYFLVSFFISATYERTRYRYVETTKDLLGKLREIRSAAEEGSKSLPQRCEMLIKEGIDITELAKLVDRSKLSSLGNEPSHYLATILDFFNNWYIDTEGRSNPDSFANRLSANISAQQSVLSALGSDLRVVISGVEEIDKSFAWAEKIKVDILELCLPILFGVVCLIAGIAAYYCDYKILN